MDGMSSDIIVWGKDPSGVVTTKAFLKSFVPSSIKRREFEVIWHSWMPLKVSIFLWKILHRALPTNDNVIRVGIPLVSKCVCCISPDLESMDHLFLHSDMAAILWDFMCRIFGKARPRSLREFFFDWGVNGSFGKVSHLFGFGLVCLCLWEIWKIRNSIIFDEGCSRFSKACIHRCAFMLSKCIPARCAHDLKSRLVCHHLHIPVPGFKEFNIRWCPWLPVGHGNSCNIAFHLSDSRSRIAAIIRDPFEAFIYALKARSTGKHFLKCFLHLICELRSSGIPFVRIQASHGDVSLLGRDDQVDWHLFQIKRRVVCSLGNVDIFKVSFSLNYPAEALVYCTVDSIRTGAFGDLPDEVQTAISQDGSPHPCSNYDQRIFI